MGQLGDGTGTNYPGGLDTAGTEVNTPNVGKTKARAAVANDIYAAVVALETELGTDPAGTLASVKAFLQTEHGTDGTHTTDAIAEKTAGAGVTIDSFKIKDNAPDPTSWPSFHASRATGTGQDNITGEDQIEYDNDSAGEGFDTNSDYDTGTFGWTPTVAGKYIITASIEWENLTVGDTIILRIKLGGSTILTDLVVANGTEQSQRVTGIFAASGSEQFTVTAENTARNTSDIQGAATFTFFCGSRIA